MPETKNNLKNASGEMIERKANDCRSIENNLYDFYFSMAEYCRMEFRKKVHPRYVWYRSGRWPEYILGNRPSGIESDYIGKLAEEMRAGQLPPIWIVKEPDDRITFHEELARHGIRHLTQWTGMSMLQQEFVDRDIGPVGLKISEIEYDIDLEAWIRLVGNEVIRRDIPATGIFNLLLGKVAYCMYGSWYDGELVGTALSFTLEGTSGLYLIGTDPRFRKKGIGSAVTSFAVRDCFSKGVERVVLHATKDGRSLYMKLGFREQCHFDVLWMLGKS